MTAGGCPVCSGVTASPVVTLKGVPVFCNALLPTRAEAIDAPTGDVDLVLCDSCGLLYNATFEPELVRYSPQYENSLHFSETFRSYARGLAEGLIDRHDLRGRTIVEIGSGSGDFLSLLCELGDNRGIGFDPSHDPARRAGDASDRVQIVPRLFGGEDEDVGADFLLCQHVLEHIAEPTGLLTTIRAGLRDPRGGNAVTTYFEVPDATYMLEQVALWDLIYEHCSYFAASTLVALFEATGFTPLDHGTSFADQYLWIEATPSAPAGSGIRVADDALDRLSTAAAAFAAKVGRQIEHWSERVEELAADGDVVVWGAGSKGVTFLNLVGSARRVAGVIDVNPRKTGLHVPGTGHRVRQPAALSTGRPLHVLVMNAVYEREIRQRLAEQGLHGSVQTV